MTSPSQALGDAEAEPQPRSASLNLLGLVGDEALPKAVAALPGRPLI
jgi:hypothetical protein